MLWVLWYVARPMSLSAAQLDAFSMVIRTGSFSKAAKKLFVTQSALSHRIKALEEELGTVLIIRLPVGLKVTPAGEMLIRYCEMRNALESECIQRISGALGKRQAEQLVGTVRVGGFSSVARSLILPALSEVLKLHPALKIELLVRELRDLPSLLKKGEVDFVYLDHPVRRDAVVSEWLGNEENVLVERSDGPVFRDVFFDHDTEDETTFKFIQLNESLFRAYFKGRLARDYLDDIYAILDGVSFGLGRAVVPKHMVGERSNLRIFSEFQPLVVPVYLNYYRPPYMNTLHQALISHLRDGVAIRLKSTLVFSNKGKVLKTGP